MRRWILIVLLAVMPVQWAWASVAPYCGHETTAAAKKHFGHHEHQHQAGDQKVDDGDADPLNAVHADCEFCHLAASASLPAAPDEPIAALEEASVFATPPPGYVSHIPSGPERPDRLHATAAVRFGAAVA